MTVRFPDLNDNKQWGHTELKALRAAVRFGREVELIAQFLCRSGTVEDVRRRIDMLPWYDHAIGRFRATRRT